MWSGHFLTEYAQQIPPLIKEIKQLDNPSPYYQQIYGIEKEDRLAKVAKVSAFMYGRKEIQIMDADDSGSIAPGSTIWLTCTTVAAAAMHISGLKLRAAIR